MPPKTSLPKINPNAMPRTTIQRGMVGGRVRGRSIPVTRKPSFTSWRRMMAVNLDGVFLGCKHGIPALLRSGGGSIINTASFVAVIGAATSQIAYTASKGGVLAMTREIAVEYARQGIRANALCPGPVNTPLLAELLADPAARARRLVHVPMGRLAEASEIGRDSTVVPLISCLVCGRRVSARPGNRPFRKLSTRMIFSSSSVTISASPRIITDR